MRHWIKRGTNPVVFELIHGPRYATVMKLGARSGGWSWEWEVSSLRSPKPGGWRKLASGHTKSGKKGREIAEFILNTLEDPK